MTQRAPSSCARPAPSFSLCLPSACPPAHSAHVLKAGKEAPGPAPTWKQLGPTCMAGQS